MLSFYFSLWLSAPLDLEEVKNFQFIKWAETFPTTTKKGAVFDKH